MSPALLEQKLQINALYENAAGLIAMDFRVVIICTGAGGLVGNANAHFIQMPK